MSTTPAGDTRVFVRALRLGISPNAAVRGQSPYAVRKKSPVVFDWDTPSCRMLESTNRGEPTVFESEEEAHAKVTEFLARVRAVIRVAERAGQHRPVGAATSLFSKSFGEGAEVGGWDTAPFSEWLVERDEEQRIAAQDHAADVAAADESARAAQAAADEVRGAPPEAAFARKAPLSLGSDWRGYPGQVGIQMRQRSDGSTVYRARRGGETSASVATLSEAIGWRDQAADPVPS